MLVAISGGAGFLGLHLVRRLVDDGHELRVLDLAPLDDPVSTEGSRSFAATCGSPPTHGSSSPAPTFSSTPQRRCRSG